MKIKNVGKATIVFNTGGSMVQINPGETTVDLVMSSEAVATVNITYKPEAVQLLPASQFEVDLVAKLNINADYLIESNKKS
jgi:hypothetical protein